MSNGSGGSISVVNHGAYVALLRILDAQRPAGYAVVRKFYGGRQKKHYHCGWREQHNSKGRRGNRPHLESVVNHLRKELSQPRNELLRRHGDDTRQPLSTKAQDIDKLLHKHLPKLFAAIQLAPGRW